MAPDREGFASFNSAPKSIFSFKIYDLACGVGLWTVEIADPIYSPLAWGAGLTSCTSGTKTEFGFLPLRDGVSDSRIVLRRWEVFMQWGSYPLLGVLIPTAKDEFFFRYE
jgi:hypothetical protein